MFGFCIVWPLIQHNSFSSATASYSKNQATFMFYEKNLYTQMSNKIVLRLSERWLIVNCYLYSRCNATHTHTNTYTRIRTRKHPLAWATTPHMHNNGKAIELMWKISRNLTSLFAISSGTNSRAKNQHIPPWNLSKLISYLVWINPHAFNTKIITWII